MELFSVRPAHWSRWDQRSGGAPAAPGGCKLQTSTHCGSRGATSEWQRAATGGPLRGTAPTPALAPDFCPRLNPLLG